MKFIFRAFTLLLFAPALFAGTINGTKKISSGTASPMELWLFVEDEPNTVYRFDVGQTNLYSVPGLALPMLQTLTDKKTADIKCAKFSRSTNAAGTTVFDCEDTRHISISMPAVK